MVKIRDQFLRARHSDLKYRWPKKQKCMLRFEIAKNSTSSFYVFSEQNFDKVVASKLDHIFHVACHLQ